MRVLFITSFTYLEVFKAITVIYRHDAYDNVQFVTWWNSEPAAILNNHSQQQKTMQDYKQLHDTKAWRGSHTTIAHDS